MVRREDGRADRLRDLGAEVVLGNLDDIRQLRVAMGNVQRAYFVAPWSTNSLDHGLNFAIAAGEAKLEHVVVLGQWLSSASHPSIATRRTWLTDQFMSWIPEVTHTLINVGWFADNTMPMLGMAAQLGLLPFPLGTGANAPVSNEDIGRVVAGVLATPQPYIGMSLRPTGPEVLTPAGIARVYSDVLERPVKHMDISMTMFSKALRALGLVEPLLATQLLLYVNEYQRGAFETGGATDVVAQVTGRAAEDFATITQRYVDADSFTRRTFTNKMKAFLMMARIAFTRPYDARSLQLASGLPLLATPDYCDADASWKRTHDIHRATAQ